MKDRKNKHNFQRPIVFKLQIYEFWLLVEYKHRKQLHRGVLRDFVLYMITYISHFLGHWSGNAVARNIAEAKFYQS